MASILTILSGLIGLGVFVCFILVVVKMFQNENVGAGVASILTLFLCGIGIFVALIIGWIKADRWRIKPLMTTYTVLLVANVAISAITLPAALQRAQEAANQQQQRNQQQQQLDMPKGANP